MTLDRSRLRLLVPVLAGALGTFLYHRYSLLSGLDQVQADPGDSRFIAFVLEHWNNSLSGAADWRSPPIFWPVRNTLAYSDLLLGMGVVHAALRHGLGVFAAMNLQLVMLTACSFAAAYALFARGFRLSLWGATLGAYLFAFSWPRFAQLVHVQLQFTPLLPVLFLMVLECLRDGLRLSRAGFAWRACLAVLALALLLATTLYFAVFAAVAIASVLLLCLLDRAARSHLWSVLRRQAAPLAGAALLAAALIGPTYAFYLPLIRESHGRTWTEAVSMLPGPRGLLWMGRENWAWGWLADRVPQSFVDDRWPELRIGVGALAFAGWLASVAWALRILLGPGRRDRMAGPIALVLVASAVLELLLIHWPGHRAGWWVVWRFFPGASGIRAPARLQLVLALAMGLGVGTLLDAGLRARRAAPLLRTLLALAALGLAAEQFGRAQAYAGAKAEALSRGVASAIPRTCRAAYVIAPPTLLTPAPVLDEQHFDAQAYLAANPDVAAAWTGTPWEHYQAFGRAEGRMLDAAAARRRVLTLFYAYNYTVPLAADLAGIPVVNGLSGWQPPGWDLFDVLAPNAPARLAAWLARNHQPPESVCLAPVPLTLEMMPDLPPRLWP